MTEDATFSADSAYGSDRWCAVTLGRSYNWFRRIRPTLEVAGFPKKDTIIGLTMKADVEAWLAKRRQVADAMSRTTHHATSTGENLHAL